MTTVDFGQAVDAAKKGKRISRQGWNGKGMFVFQRPGEVIIPEVIDYIKALPRSVKNFLKEKGQEVSFLPYLCMYTATGEIVNGWLASQTDILATDWCILD